MPMHKHTEGSGAASFSSSKADGTGDGNGNGDGDEEEEDEEEEEMEVERLLAGFIRLAHEPESVFLGPFARPPPPPPVSVRGLGVVGSEEGRERIHPLIMH